MEDIERVMLQRDKLQEVLAELYDKLRHGVFNGILPEKNPRGERLESSAKCKKGKTRREVQWCMGCCCRDCDPIGDCHVSLEEWDVFKAMCKAREALKEQPAEMPLVRPEDFPHYEDGIVYNPSARWIARQFYRFAIGYWLFANHADKEQEKDWERAYNDILSISLRDKGPVFRKLMKAVMRITDQEEAKKFISENPDVDKLMENAAESITKSVKGEEDVDLLVLQALTLRMDYRFGHEYPGGDMDVYDGVFCGLIDNCLTVAGLEPKDRPKSYDFEDKEEYERVHLAYEHGQKMKIYAFMRETGGMGMV